MDCHQYGRLMTQRESNRQPMTGRRDRSAVVPRSTSMSRILAGRCLFRRSKDKKEPYCKGRAVQAIRRALAPAIWRGVWVVVALAIELIVIPVWVHYLGLISLVGKKSQRGKSCLDDSDEQRGCGIVLKVFTVLVERYRRVSDFSLDC